MSIASWIQQWATTDRVAFHFEGAEVTYAELAARIEVTAQAFVAAGVTPGDRVGYCGLNRIELFEALFGAARIGAIFVPLNNRLTATELAVQIDDCDPTILLAADGFEQLLVNASDGRQIRDLDSDPFIATGPSLAPDPVARDAMVLMVYTSGTTGNPKGAMLSHDAMVHTVLNSVDHQQFNAEDITVAPLPTFHVGGLNIQTLPTLYVGGQVLLQRRFEPAGVLDLIAAHRATQVLLVPAMLAAVASQPTFAVTDLSSLRGINSGSSLVPAQVMQPFFDRGIAVGQVYGTTETGPTAIVLNYDEAAAHVGSCGKPAQHTDLRIVDRRGRDAAVGTPGELWLRGPNIFTKYWNRPDATKQAFAEGGWFRTGDIGFRDPDGYVYISDRISDIVISGGENVYPAEIEPVLQQHPDLVEVAIIGRPDEKWGEIPIAVAVLEPGSTLTIEGLRDWCEDHIARFKQPRELRIVDALPRTALGKVQKHLLR